MTKNHIIGLPAVFLLGLAFLGGWKAHSHFKFKIDKQ